MSGEYLDKNKCVQITYGCDSSFDEYGQLITKMTMTDNRTLETQHIIQAEIKAKRFSIFREIHKSTIFCITDVKNCDYLFVVNFTSDRIASLNITPQQFCDDLNACLNGVGSIVNKILINKTCVGSNPPEISIHIIDKHYTNLIGTENIICTTSVQQIDSPIPHIELPSAKRGRDEDKNEDQTTDNKRQKQ